MEDFNGIAVFDNVFDGEYCNKVIKYFEHCVDMGLGRDRTGENANTIDKNDVASFMQLNVDKISLYSTAELSKPFNEGLWASFHQYATKYGVIKNFGPLTNFDLKIQKTSVGQGYHVWHCEKMNRCSTDRIATFIAYLNDVEEGGETEFLYFPKRVKAKTGRMVICSADYLHTHRGNPPISNTKYIVTGWVTL